MKLSEVGEFGLINQIRRAAINNSRSVKLGIGDDAAVLRIAASSDLLATTDMLLEGIHFDLSYTDFFSLGWKSAAVNLSDIAAMGGRPRFCLVALGLPSSVAVSDVMNFYLGFMKLARKHGVLLAGGDTCRSKNRVVVSVTALGEAVKGAAVSRSGAKPGDHIFVTGALGDSAAGLKLLKARNRPRNPAAMRLIKRHLRPEPRVGWGSKLSDSGCVSAMIDISDGLSSDLLHICDESRTGAEIFIDRIPISKELFLLKDLRRNVMKYVLSGGEDYELLFTVPEERINEFRRLRIPAFEIGKIIVGRSIFTVDKSGRKQLFVSSGFDHFRSSAKKGRNR